MIFRFTQTFQTHGFLSLRWLMTNRVYFWITAMYSVLRMNTSSCSILLLLPGSFVDIYRFCCSMETCRVTQMWRTARDLGAILLLYFVPPVAISSFF